MLIEEILQRFKSAPPIRKITDQTKIDSLYREWRIRMMYSTFIGYAIFYFCRKNISIALPAIGSDLGFSNMQLGLLGSVLYITYGIGRFFNGVLADKANPKYFMTTGLVLTAVANILFGMSSSLWALAVYWGLNGWFQSIGFPPCSKVLANWYSVSERATKWSIWHISHQLGAFVIAIFAGFLVEHYGWRFSFYIPAGICMMTAFFLFNRLADTPPSLGLPNIADYHNDIELNVDGSAVNDSEETIRHILFHRVFNNPHIWLVGFMTLFIYILRIGVFDWSTKYLVETKGSTIVKAGVLVSVLELVGIAGSVGAGLITDKLWSGKRAPWCFICFLMTILGLALFYFSPPGNSYYYAGTLAAIGFFVYGPQFLQGPFAADLASRKAAATANGLMGIFGYAGAALAGVGSGYFVDLFGWKGGFIFWVIAAILGAIISLMLWNVKTKKPAK